MKRRLRPVAVLICSLPTVLVGAQGADEEADEAEIVTVVATRTERSLDEVAATIVVKTAADMEREMARNIADLVRFEPGVSVGGTGSRFGLGGFAIRGIGGNRVLTLVDGVRVSEEFSFGPLLSARRDFVELDSLDRVEIARGPISTLYGSDALGGVVAMSTRGPDAYVDDETPLHASVKLGYSSADAAAVGSLNLAGAGGPFSALLRYTNRDGSETATAGAVGGTGPAREQPDPQSVGSDNVTAKARFKVAGGHALTLTVDDFSHEVDTRVLSDYGMSFFGATTDRRHARDTRQRTRWSAAYRVEDALGFADTVDAVLYRQTSESGQNTFEDRTAMDPATRAPVSQTRRRFSLFEQEIQGAYVQAGKRFALAGGAHHLTYGFDYYATDTASRRDGGTFAADGRPMREFFLFPTRDFPLTEVRQVGFFVQDEVELFDGRLVLAPGVRYDRFDASAEADALYLEGNPGTPLPADHDDAEVTFKLGAVFSATEATALYARYSEGFRTPPYDDVNVGFTNFVGGYKTISNPGLESERSQGLEAGWRFSADNARLRVAVFRNVYDNFIEPLVLAPAFAARGGIDPADGLQTFQSINRDEVTIQGVELGGELRLGVLGPALGNASLRFAAAYADGEDRATKQPLNSVDPLTAVLGLAYSTADGRFGAEIVCTLAQGKDAGDIDQNDPRLDTAGYGVVDAIGYVHFSNRLALNIGLFNVTDKTYIRWADSAGIGTDAPLRFSQPGFNASATLRFEF